MRAFVLAAVLVAHAAWAQVPNLVGYQGRLLKADGTPVVGTATLIFTFFDAPTGGSPLWIETQTVALTDGFYATYLGTVTPLPANLFAGGDRFLEVSVNGSPLTPRLRAGSVPFALSATDARNVSGGTVNAQSFAVGGVQVIDATGKLVGPASAVTQVNTAPPLQTTGGTVPTLSLSSCAVGEVLKWNGNAWACAQDNAGADGGGVSQVTATAPLLSSGGTEPNLTLTTSCSTGQVLKFNGTAWTCAADDVGSGGSGGVTSVIAGPGVSVTGTQAQPVVGVVYGTAANTAVVGNDQRLVPPGSVTAYLGLSPPPGWVMADGAAASRTGCAGLFGVIGTAYGAGDGTTTFNVPNLNDRRFLMGRSAAEPLGSTGGSFDHTHGVTSHNHTMSHQHGMLHTHTTSAHNHTMPHNHSMPHSHTMGHTHGVDPPATATNTGNGDYAGACADGTARECGIHSHNVDLAGFTSASSAGSTGGTFASTAGASTTTTSSSSSTTGASGSTTGTAAAPSTFGGGGATGTANPPFFAVNYILKC